jgi:heme oxygenase (biliverdin-IX-beta and delta-forming)
MRPPNDLRNRLRETTREDHARIDSRLATLDLACAADYTRFLAIHAAALSQLGGRTAPGDRADTDALLSCLGRDLEYYGLTAPRAVVAASDESRAHQLGISYVIRGSRLGAQILVRRVAPAAPSEYLGYPLSTTWTSFLERLESSSRQQPAQFGQEVIAGAKAAFNVFLRVSEHSATVYS